MQVILGVEDAPSEAVLMRLIEEHQGPLEVANVLGRRGNQYLKTSMPKFGQTSQQLPVVVLTDSDAQGCVVKLVEEWRSRVPFDAPNLLLRVAVCEVESWILADQDAARILLSRPNLAVPPNLDDVSDPKNWLLQAARKSPKRVRDDLVRFDGSLARVGLGYNDRLVGCVRSDWSPAQAAARSPSLTRARSAIAALAARYSS